MCTYQAQICDNCFVDYFKQPTAGNTFFLTHFHAGTSSKVIKLIFRPLHRIKRLLWWKAVLQRNNQKTRSSQISWIVQRQCGKHYNSFSLLNAKISLQTNNTCLITLNQKNPSSSPTMITVTFIPANHCPGSVMYISLIIHSNCWKDAVWRTFWKIPTHR